MFDFKKAEFDKPIFNSAFNAGTNDLRNIWEEIAPLAKSRDDYVHQTTMSRSAYELGKEIERLRREKDTRIKAFDSESVVLERKAKHRAEWLAAHGK